MAALANPWIIKRITMIYLKYIKVKCSVHLIYWDTFLKKKRKKKLLGQLKIKLQKGPKMKKKLLGQLNMKLQKGPKFDPKF